MPPPDADKFYGFTVLACQLNEPEEGVAPTDSRLRPDQRFMEEGLWQEANQEKIRLEEKQRAVRRQREAEAEKAASEGKTQFETGASNRASNCLRSPVYAVPADLVHAAERGRLGRHFARVQGGVLGGEGAPGVAELPEYILVERGI